MAPKAAQVAPTISASDSAILAAVIANLKGTLDADWEAVTRDCNLKNVSTTRTRYNQVKRKLMDLYGTKTGVTAAPDDTDAAGDNDDFLLGLGDQSSPKTPVKKRKTASNKGSTGKKRKIKEESQVDQDGMGTPTTPIDKIVDETSILEDTPETPAKLSAKKPKNETPKLNPAFNISVADFTSGYGDGRANEADDGFLVPQWINDEDHLSGLLDTQQNSSQ